MTVKGSFIAILISVIVGGISYFFSASVSLITLGIFYLFLGFVHMTNRTMYDKIITIINIDKVNAYKNKDDEFKSYIKDNPVSMIFIGGVLFYLAYRLYGQATNVRYSISLMILVFGSYFIDTYSIVKSNSWEECKKKSLIWMIALVIIYLFILSL